MKTRTTRRKAYWHRTGERRYPCYSSRCSMYCAGCLNCAGWRRYYETGSFPTIEEALRIAEPDVGDLNRPALDERPWSEIRKEV